MQVEINYEKRKKKQKELLAQLILCGADSSKLDLEELNERVLFDFGVGSYAFGNLNIFAVPFQKMWLEKKLISLISLSGNKLKEIHKDLFEYFALTNLDISSNMLKVIPKQIGNLKKLKELDLSENLISELPNEIKYLKDLKYLKLNDNPITRNKKELLKIEKLLPKSTVVFT